MRQGGNLGQGVGVGLGRVLALGAVQSEELLERLYLSGSYALFQSVELGLDLLDQSFPLIAL
jgi:hypothetical protein